MCFPTVRVLTALIMGAYTCQAHAQSFPIGLEGYSMTAERVEDLPDENPPFSQHWHERIYFGRGGHLFSKQTLESGNQHNAGSFAMMSGQTYGQQVAFQWDGSGVSRQWTNPTNGVVLTMTMRVKVNASHFSCDLNLDRQGYSKRVVLEQENCRIFKGNAVAD